MKKILRPVFRIVFGRTMLTIMMFLIQIGILFAGFRWLSAYMHVAITGFSLLGGFLIVYIINKEDNPAFKMAWILPVCLLPVFGALFYLSVLLNPGGLGLKKQVQEIGQVTRRMKIQKEGVREAMKAAGTGISRLGFYLEDCAGFPACRNTEVTYFPLGEDMYADLLEELKKAEHFIFMEYFIIDKGEMWDGILKILEEKAKKGVEVRVMYDGMCSLILLPYHYPEKLKKMGIQAKMFAPIIPLFSTHQNNRDHRKITVIDGRVAYTGGVNLADEYINKKERFGHWKDTAVKLAGDAVWSFTLMFLGMWNIWQPGREDYTRYRTVLQDTDPLSEQRERGFVIPYGDSPYDGENTGENVYMDMLYQAENYVHIMTPYLIIDNEMLTALQYAAKSGVDVKLILPHIPDKKAAFYIARTYYPALLKAGVKIYEYRPGFVHAKCFVVDGKKAAIGSINLDYRSFYLHFECGVYIYGNPAISHIEEDFENTLEKCIPVDMKYYRSLPVWEKGYGRILKLIAPLL